MYETGETRNPFFAQISLAQLINSLSRGAVIAPWEINQLPEEWIEAFRLMGSRGKLLERAKQVLSKAKKDWLSRFPNYHR
jgi:hypothetical protein